MKKALLVLAAMAVAVGLSSCKKDDGGKDDGGKSDSSQTAPYALDLYWDSSWSGKLGIQMGSLSSDSSEKRMILGGVPLYVTGTNCYNLFVQCFEADNMQTGEIEATVKELVANKVPIVRFSCGPYYASQMHYYTEQKTKYLQNLDYLANLCDEGHILLIPSFFWNTSCVPEYCGEDITAWGVESSKTFDFMKSYVADIVGTLKDHKCLAAWEFGNEFSLQADIGIAGYTQIPATDVQTAYRGFANAVKAADPEGRLICSGNSIMRNSQWHQFHEASWGTDSFAQYEEITDVMTPDPMKGMSEHIYEDSRSFSDLGDVNRTYQVIWAKRAAKDLGKVYYVGEFTGPKTASGDSAKVKAHYIVYYNQKVQISMIWNYALRGNIEYSFKASDYDGFPFSMMRRYNEMYRKMKAE